MALGEGSQPIEIFGTKKEFVACFPEPRLNSQVAQNFSRVTVFVGLRRRHKISDQVNFPQAARRQRI